MRNTLNKKTTQHGFTLIEMCIVLLIIGILIAPAISIYNQYETSRKIEQTNNALKDTANNIEGFLTNYGRYPCPAPADAVPGDIDYGYEECGASTGIQVVASNRAASDFPASNNNVLIGSIPFRTLNLQETQVNDGYGNRLTYAVTQVQTDIQTYRPNLGGISLIDNASPAASVITPPDTAPFAIVAHGDANDGAVSYSGTTIGTCASGLTLDVENCNNDSTFLVSDKTQEYDDNVVYASGVGALPWQYQNITRQDIHLKVGSSNVVTGEANLTSLAMPDPTTLPTGLEIRNDLGEEPTTEGVLLTERELDLNGNPINGSGAIVTNEICVDPTNCFSPRIFGGNAGVDAPVGTPVVEINSGATYGNISLDDSATPELEGGRIYCPGNQVMTGIANGQALCTDVVTLSCPTGESMRGIDTDGKIICEAPPASSCPPLSITTFCGTTATLPSVPPGTRSAVYSGVNYVMPTPFNGAAAATYTTLATLQAHIDTLNNDPARRITQPATGAGNGLVRDSVECVAGGSTSAFDMATLERYEKGRYTTNLATSTAYASPNNSGPGYNSADPMSVNPNNTMSNVDCWCREKYRVREVANCPSGGGYRLYVDLYRCANTSSDNHSSNWTNVWNSGTTHCACAPGTYTQTGPTCASHFGVPSEGMTGNVINNYTRTCSGGVATNTLTSVDTSACACPRRNHQIPQFTNACPSGNGNSFTFEGQNYTDIQEVHHRRWTCPAGPTDATGSGPSAASSAAHAGFWTLTTRTEACTCNNGELGTAPSTCPPTQTGTRTIETALNCSTGDYEPTGNDVTNTCTPCSWRPPGGAPAGNDPSILAVSAYGSCNCNGSVMVQRCKSGSGDYWNGCQCSPVY